MKWLYLLIVAAMILGKGYGLTCLNCRGIVQPRHCKYVTQCEPGEVCGAETVVTDHGEVLYHLGCRPSTHCHNTSGSNCHECCSTDLCNARSCGEPGYPLHRGPICYNCHDYPAERFCHDIQFCHEGEVCSLKSMDEFGDNITTRSCEPQLTCESSPNNVIIGRRSVSEKRYINTTERTCDVCCERDLCNGNCDGNNGIDTNECSRNPCVHGVCYNSIHGFNCSCYPGYSGRHCDHMYDPCASNPCLNGSTCWRTNGTGYTCLCFHGMTGPRCDQVYDPCASNPCLNGSTCWRTNGTGYTCLCFHGMTGPRCDQVLYQDCLEILTNGHSLGSGVYTVYLKNMTTEVQVYCDMDTQGGGWTVFQRRFNGHVDFYRNFSQYEYGFGNVSGEHWLGLRFIYEMTLDAPDLRYDVVDHLNHTAYDMYEGFYMSDPRNYTLHLARRSNNYSIVDSGRNLLYNQGRAFSTFDRDLSEYHSCATMDHGAWWYLSCTFVNLNGEYITPGTTHPRRAEAGVIIYEFNDFRSLKETKMMFRRRTH